ncbi:MAG: dihydroneopterin aldolase [Nitrospiraceae bacterium]
MSDQLVLERLEFQAHIGVSVEERQVAQTIGVDLELDYEPRILHTIAATDDISTAIDYSHIAERVVQIGCEREFHLLETLAERLCRMLFEEFSISKACVWVRKLKPPINDLRGSAGVRLERTRADQIPEPRPARFLLDHWHRLPKGDALDLAAGHGRHTEYLAAQGYFVEAIDRDEQALAELATRTRQRHLRVSTRTLDLEQDPERDPGLPKERYDVILVFFYLHRPIFPALLQALKPGGALMYETFLIDNHTRFQHPRRREFCLAHNELLQLTRGLRVLHYEEGEHEGTHGFEPVFTARLLAQRAP